MDDLLEPACQVSDRMLAIDRDRLACGVINASLVREREKRRWRGDAVVHHWAR